MNRRLLIRALAPLALAATLAACGDDTDAASGAGEDTTTTEAPGTDERERDPDDHPDGGEDATEVGESAPRLLVADGTDAVVTVIDLATAEEITELQVTGPARLTAVGRHVLAAPGGWNRIQVEVDDLDATVEALRRDGVALRSEIIQGNGGRQVVADDPSGNPIELFEPRRAD